MAVIFSFGLIDNCQQALFFNLGPSAGAFCLPKSGQQPKKLPSFSNYHSQLAHIAANRP